MNQTTKKDDIKLLTDETYDTVEYFVKKNEDKVKYYVDLLNSCNVKITEFESSILEFEKMKMEEERVYYRYPLYKKIFMSKKFILEIENTIKSLKAEMKNEQVKFESFRNEFLRIYVSSIDSNMEISVLKNHQESLMKVNQNLDKALKHISESKKDYGEGRSLDNGGYSNSSIPSFRGAFRSIVYSLNLTKENANFLLLDDFMFQQDKLINYKNKFQEIYKRILSFEEIISPIINVENEHEEVKFIKKRIDINEILYAIIMNLKNLISSQIDYYETCIHKIESQINFMDKSKCAELINYVRINSNANFF